jgi:O-acetylserine/cysteine efflux transporter
MLLTRYPAGIVAPFSMLVPVFGIGSSWLFLGETTDAVELAFGALVVIGVLAGTRRAHSKSLSVPAPERDGGNPAVIAGLRP